MADNQIIIYQTEDGQTKVDVILQNETVWLTQAQMAELFQRDRTVITKHISNIFAEGELDKKSVCANFALTAADGKVYHTDCYNLDVVISVGYRVKSLRGTQFRIWAGSVLKEYLIKGFAMNDELLKKAGGGDYWRELLERIRDIRSSERVLYRQVLDLYATSVDYNPKSQESIEFFKIVQNKLHYIAAGQTAAQIIKERANADKPFMGLLTFSGTRPKKSDISIAKNYLTETELAKLNRAVSAYFDIAEFRAINKKPTYMTDWIKLLDDLAKSLDTAVLEGAGTVSHLEALAKAESEYSRYKELTKEELSPVETAFLDTIKKTQKQLESSKKKN